MRGARVVTVGAGPLVSGDDGAALAVVRLLQDTGLPVLARETVDESEVALERVLELAVEDAALVVLLAQAGGSAGDIVRRVVARLAVARLVLNERVLDSLQADFATRGRAMPRRLDRLALLPQGAELWPAPGEPGWALAVRRALVAVLPLGSPHLRALLEGPLRAVAEDVGGAESVTLMRTLRTAGLGLADAEERLGAWLGREGPVAVSCLPADGEVWVRLTCRAASRSTAEARLDALDGELRGVLGEDCYGQDGETLEGAVARRLETRGLRLSTAESCTGGLLAHRLTGPPGASRIFDRGLVAYSLRAKQELLGVPGELLETHGAVSAPVAEAMARGAARTGRSPCALAVTGFTGPGGGAPDRPVGTVFVAALTPDGVTVRRHVFAGSRDAVMRQAVTAALDLLRRLLRRP
jgi:nicotinamide-nucleotide amidase